MKKIPNRLLLLFYNITKKKKIRKDKIGFVLQESFLVSIIVPFIIPSSLNYSIIIFITCTITLWLRHAERMNVNNNTPMSMITK